MGPPSDYSGQLFSFRNSSSRAELRTLTFAGSERYNVGIQEMTDGRQHRYKCVASNFGATTNYSVVITFTGELLIL